jgi:hypothetical protein
MAKSPTTLHDTHRVMFEPPTMNRVYYEITVTR